MDYCKIQPATDWFFVIEPSEYSKALIVWRLALWGITADEGHVIGLVSVPGGGHEDKIMHGTCRLLSVPPIRGIYKHYSELNCDEIEAIKNGGLNKLTDWPAIENWLFKPSDK